MAKTRYGMAEVPLPEHFALVTSDSGPLTVLLTPEGNPVRLFVKEKSKQKIVVAAEYSDQRAYGDVEFAYQVTGIRDGFENMQAILDVESDDYESVGLQSEKQREKKRRVLANMERHRRNGKRNGR